MKHFLSIISATLCAAIALVSCGNSYPEELCRTAPVFVKNHGGKKLVAMDLDATLTQHKTDITDANIAALDQLGKKYELVMICAGNAPRVYKQMRNYPIAIVGNYGMQEAHVEGDSLVIVRQDTCPADTAFFMEKTNYLRDKYGFTKYYGDPVEFHASGMVTFALIGTTAPTEEKLVFDPDKSKRRAMYPEVCEIFGDNYSIFIGGSTSFDFAGKQYNKYDATMRYAESLGYTQDEVIFIGDDFGDGGGDSHVRIKGMDYIHIHDYTKFPEAVQPLLDAKK